LIPELQLLLLKAKAASEDIFLCFVFTTTVHLMLLHQCQLCITSYRASMLRSTWLTAPLHLFLQDAIVTLLDVFLNPILLVAS
jgi:hypothetical protein